MLQLIQTVKLWLDRRKALHELYAINNQPFSAFFSDQINMAKEALDQGATERATRIWHEMNAQYPDLTATSQKAFELLIALGHYDEAESLIQLGSRRYRGYGAFFSAISESVAYSRGDLKEALRRCTVGQKKYPKVAHGYDIAAACLDRLGRQDEAEMMLKKAVRKIPDSFELSVRYAQAAVKRRDWSEAIRRWHTVCLNFEHLPGPLGMAECLRETGHFAEAERILIDASERFHTNPWSFVELANIAAVKGDAAEAATRWQSVLSKFPWFEASYLKAAEAFRIVGREVQAEEVLLTGLTRFPDNLMINLEYARSAHRRREWAVAAERWTSLRVKFPDCAEAHEQQEKALVAMSS